MTNETLTLPFNKYQSFQEFLYFKLVEKIREDLKFLPLENRTVSFHTLYVYLSWLGFDKEQSRLLLKELLKLNLIKQISRRAVKFKSPNGRNFSSNSEDSVKSQSRSFFMDAKNRRDDEDPKVD